MRGEPRPQPFERLTKRKDFVAAASGRRFHTERMTVQGLLRDEAEGRWAGMRVGLTVTKRVGSAVERNRIKRRLRSATREAAAIVGAEPTRVPLDVVVVARRPALTADFQALVADFAASLTKVAKPGGPGGRGREGSRERPSPKGASGPRRGRGGAPSTPS